MAFAAEGVPALLALDVHEAGSGNLKEVVAGHAEDWPLKVVHSGKVGLLVIGDAGVRAFPIAHLLDPLDPLLKELGPLFKCRPDGGTLGDGPQLGPLELIQEVVVLIQQLLLLLHPTDHCQLNLADQSLVYLCVNEDVPCPCPQSVLHPHDVEGVFWVVALLSQSSHQVDDFAFLGGALAPEKVEDFEADKVEVVKVLAGLLLEKLVRDADLGLVDDVGDVKEEIDELVQLAADVGGNCALEVGAVLADAYLLVR